MSYEQIRYEVAPSIATITLDRPDVLNAYQPRMGDELVAAFGQARDDEAVRVVILTGAGRAFCAGVDLKFMKEQAEREARGDDFVRIGEEHFVRGFAKDLADFPKPVIVAINGAAIGVGVTMALPCDVRIAAEGAKLGLTFTKLGITPGLGSTHLLPKIVGLAKALELVLSARVIGADEACEIGLVNRVVPGDDLLAAAREMAAAMAECDPAALAVAKRNLQFGAAASLEASMQQEQLTAAELARRRKR